MTSTRSYADATTQITSRGRPSGMLPRAALMFGTALGCSIVIAAAAPGIAFAANECGPTTNSGGTDTATCTSANNTYPTGITYIETNPDNLAVDLQSGVIVNAVGHSGVIAVGYTGYDVSIYNAAGSSVTSTRNGLVALGYSGDASVVNNGDVTAAYSGIIVSAFGPGDVSATNTGNVTVNTSVYNASGIHAYAQTGNATIVNTGNVAVTGTSDYVTGLSAFAHGAAGTGVANIYNSGAVNVSTSGRTAIGINVYGSQGVNITGGGDINVSQGATFGGVNPAYDYAAIGVQALSSGPVNIDVGNVTATGYSAQGIVVETFNASQPINVFFGNVTETTTGAFVGGDGLNIYGAAGAPINIVGGSVTTVGNYNTGISVGGHTGIAGDTYVNVGSVSTDGYHSDGIKVGGHGTITIDAGTVTTIGDESTGVHAFSDLGDVAVNTGKVTTYGIGSQGVYAESTAGNVAVSAGATITHAGYADAIYVRSVDGTATANAAFVRTYSVHSTGIYANGLLGATVTSSNAVFTSAAYSTGISAVANDGAAMVTENYINTSGDNSPGVEAYGRTSATVAANTVITGGDASTAISATSDVGTASVSSAYVHTTGVGSDGVDAYGYSGATVNNTGYVETAGNLSSGIHASAYNGPVSVTSHTVVTEGYRAFGIAAETYTGDVTINSGTVVTHGDYAFGVAGESYTGNVSLTSGTAETYGAYAPAVFATSLVAGNVTVVSGNAVTRGVYSPAITARGYAGDVSVTANGSTRTYGAASDAIDAYTVTSGNVLVVNNGTVNAHDGVGVHAGSAGLATINNHGAIYGGYGGVVATSVNGTTINNSSTGLISGGGGYAIGVTGGAATINNAGHIFGRANLTANNDTVNNTGTWTAYGTTNFGAGTDTFNNSGTVRVAPLASVATTTNWTGLEAFNNSGLVDLRNGHTGDVFNLTSDTGGTTFAGSGNSALGVDASLSAALTSDRLNIGAAAGSTSLLVNDTTPGSPGALNFTGVTVVHATSGAPGAFTWVGRQKGFVDYELEAFGGAGGVNYNIVGLPDQAAFEFLKVPQMGQDFWRRSGDAWTAREQEIRDSMWGSSPATRGEGWEMWSQAQIGGERLSREQNFTIGGTTFTPNLGTNDDWRGFQVGADHLSPTNWMWGFTGGFLEQNTQFRADRNSVDLTGWNFGAYAGWTSGRFFVNGLVKGDWFDAKANLTTIPAYQTFSGDTWGAKGETGFRFGGERFYMEPVADLAWTTTHTNDANFTSLATNFNFGTANSLRGSVGARVGGDWGSIMPYVGLYAVQEFEGKNDVTMVTGAGCPVNCLSLTDTRPGGYGRADLGFTTKSWNGLEGFMKGEAEFGNHTEGFAGRLGVRWRW